MPAEMTYWRGSPFDPRTVDMLKEAQRLCSTRDAAIYLEPSQGSYQPATDFSWDTHSGTGAVDLKVRFMTAAQRAIVVWAMRSVGFAYWTRDAIPGLWPVHGHGIALPPDLLKNTHGLSAGAFQQTLDYLDGLNGLSSGGRDPHPRPTPIQSWETYQEETMALSAEDKAWISAEIKKQADAAIKSNARNFKSWPWQATWGPLKAIDKLAQVIREAVRDGGKS